MNSLNAHPPVPAGSPPVRRAAPRSLTLVVPVFNEAEAVPHFVRRISDLFSSPEDPAIEMLFVNDGSRDSTLEELLSLQRLDPRIRIVDLSRNFGKEAALSAGLDVARGDVVVPIDVDLQDPPELIAGMIDKWRDGYEVVAAKRASRNADSWAKRISAGWFYRIHNQISDIDIPENVGDFRLMDRTVVEALRQMPESRRFMKGIFAWMGFRTATVEYARPERVAGTSKFHGWKLWNFALEGTTSFSTVPLRIWTYIGGSVALLSIGFALYTVVKVLIFGIDVPGYASIVVAISLLGGLQLMGIGVLGEYLGRTYMESKRRPVFLIRSIYEGAPAEAATDGSHP
jgi:glycosyltransferase involved in cell wall biosynthesis